ncbi:VHS domain-containing protein/GAT domain-containing protein, partial [Cephalotus follicularis]
MAAELVNSVTDGKLVEMDWTKSIQMCELVARDPRQARDAVKVIKKRLGSKNSNTQLYSVMLLEMLMNNIGEDIHKQVIDTGVLPILLKIVKKKSDLPVREKIFLLLDATQTSLGGASGKFPQYYTAYYDLVSVGVQFSQRQHATPSYDPSSLTNKDNTLNGELASSRREVVARKAEHQVVPESSIVQKARNTLQVLKEVLDAIDTQNPEAAKDEFTLDLVEQCSFQKQRVMHLAMTSREEKLVSRAIELNELLQKVLERHDAILLGRSKLSDWSITTANHHNHEKINYQKNPNHEEINSRNNGSSHEEVEEEEDELFRRIRKGKACVNPDDDEYTAERLPFSLFGLSIPAQRLNRPLIRSLSSELTHEPNAHPPSVAIPPPPAKYIERERFFQEKKADGHMRGLPLHSRKTSSSCSGSMDFSD